MPDDLDLDALKALTDAATPRPWIAGGRWLHPWELTLSERYPMVEMESTDQGGADAAFIAAARTAVPALIAEVERLRGELDREYQRAEGWADQYNRVARQIADLRDERDTALVDAKQARVDARDSQADAWAEVQRLDALLQTVTAERDRRGDELRRAQAVISLLSKRIADLRAEADEEFCTCGSYDCHGECCGVGNCTCTALEGQP